MNLPQVQSTPCHDCPWRRDSAPGWLGPFTAEEWVMIAHSDEPIACHLTLPTDGKHRSEQKTWDYEGVEQCAGAAIYRTNILKLPRDPNVATLPRDTDSVFGFDEFEQHHQP